MIMFVPLKGYYSQRFPSNLFGFEKCAWSKPRASSIHFAHYLSLLLTLGEPYGEPVSTMSIACFSGSDSSQQRQVIVLAMIAIDDVDTNTRKIIDTAPMW